MIHLSDLNDNVFVYLEDNFREEFFNEANRKNGCIWEKLCRDVKYSIAQFYDIKRGYKRKMVFMKLKLVRSLSKISGISLEKIERKILHIKYGSTGRAIKINFPIPLTPEIATLLGHALGDGHIKSKKGYIFDYRNKSYQLIKKVRMLVRKTFKIDPKIYQCKDGTQQLEAPSIVGYILYVAGAPRGDKVLKRFQIPEWITNGSQNIKSVFLQSLYDDEAGMDFKNRSIRLTFAKRTGLKDNLSEFLEMIKKLLLDLEIKSNEVHIYPLFKRATGIRTIAGSFYITNQKNFRLFHKNINFSHPIKKVKLEKAIESYVRPYYERYRNGEAKNKIFNILSSGSKYTTEITKLICRHNSRTCKYLKEMEKDKMIKRIGRKEYGEILWTLRG